MNVPTNSSEARIPASGTQGRKRWLPAVVALILAGVIVGASRLATKSSRESDPVTIDSAPATTMQGRKWWLPAVVVLIFAGMIVGVVWGGQWHAKIWAPLFGAFAGVASLGTSNLFPNQQHDSLFKPTAQFVWACASSFALGLTVSASTDWQAIWDVIL